MNSGWQAHLKERLSNVFGKKSSDELSQKYFSAFPAGYIESSDIEAAVSDIRQMETLTSSNPLDVSFYSTENNAEYPFHLRVLQWEKPIPLSEILPLLENFNLRINNVRSEVVKPGNGTDIWISDFTVAYGTNNIDIDQVKDLFHDAFIHINVHDAENDGLNKLILGASLSWRKIIILRTYAKYLKQIGFHFSQAYIEKTLVGHPNIAQDLVALFEVKNDPSKQEETEKKSETIEHRIIHALESVTSLDEDRIIRRLIDLIKATLRTNFYQKDATGSSKNYLSMKFDSSAIPELPVPVPFREIFVYSPSFEGIHLRSATVARGGIRWSDRLEDYRTEVLGLMKAQKTKNAVIVPMGAKGGFVAKEMPAGATRDVIQKQVILYYQSFIRGLLDITDNIVEDVVVSPKDVVCHDSEDPYLVVAADKGTATFSDIANTLSKEYHFWLGDAFASGGSAGYDHKKMGITAKGTWESVKRHFRENDIDVMTTPITVVGIGDMSGDVFGNGMLYTKQIKLLAAFDHRNIFLDPNPDPLTSFEERQRLFNLPTSSWEDYNPKLISEGGGIYKRSLKSIPLSPQMQTVLDSNKSSMTPLELIRAILKAPVDLLFNGGIGTYVKASKETHADVGDRTNEFCRVNGHELRCKVVGEGGNLGLTQLGRVEYVQNGGVVNADFIDNSAGVDCSDHEVNLKILLDHEIASGHLKEEERNPLLASLTEEIAELVLKDNYYQAFIISFSVQNSKKNVNRYQKYIKDLESSGLLDRNVEYLPDEKKLLERKEGLTRPELAVLLAYTKLQIKQQILDSELPEEPYLADIVETAFPPSVRAKYGPAMKKHHLFREIFATQVSNKIVNEMGFTFVYRMQIDTGATIDEIIRAYMISSRVFDTENLTSLIESLGFNVSLATQYEMFYHIRTLTNLATRWFLHSEHIKDNIGEVIEHFSKRIEPLKKLIPTLMGGQTKQYFDNMKESFTKKGLPVDLARTIATYRAIYTALNIIDVTTSHHFELLQTAKVYFLVGEKVNLLWMRDKISSDTREGFWNDLARLTLRDELDMSQRLLTIAVLKNDPNLKDPEALVDKWLGKNQRTLERWNFLSSLVQSSPSVDYTMFFVAIRELFNVIKLA